MNESIKNVDTTGEGVSEFKNDNVVVTLKREPGCRVTMDVTISPKASQAAYKKAIKAVNKEVSLPGFRKGKAPEAMIIQNYGEHVERQWQELMVQTSFSEALALTEVYPFSKELMHKPIVKKISQQEPSNIVFQFESEPQVPEIDPATLVIKKVERKEVTPEAVEEAIQELRLYHAKWEKVTDRSVQEGDYIDVDIEDLDNPGRFLCKDTRFEVAKEKMGEWMRQLVLGKKVQDTVEGTSERPSDFDPEKEFKPTRCRITIKAIQTASLPELDQEFAKKVGLSTIEKMKEAMTQNLNDQADKEVRQKLRDQIEQALFEQYPFDIPVSILQKEVKVFLDRAKKQMQESGQSEENIAKRLQEMEKELEEKVRKTLHMLFISDKVAKANDIGIADKELVQEIIQLISSRSISNKETPPDMEELRRQAYQNLLLQKVKDFLLDRATVE